MDEIRTFAMAIAVISGDNSLSLTGRKREGLRDGIG